MSDNQESILPDPGMTASETGMRAKDSWEMDTRKSSAPMTPQPQSWAGPQTVDEAKAYHEGFKAGVKAYAEKLGCSTDSPEAREVIADQGWETIETFERLTLRKT